MSSALSSPNIKDVARVAKVSHMTVARVFSGGSVAEHTRHRILNVARQMGYSPHPLARGLRGGRTASISLCWTIGEFLGGDATPREVIRRIQRRGYTAYLLEPVGQSQPALTLLEDIRRRQPDGMVMQVSEMDLAEKDFLAALRKFDSLLLVSPLPLETDHDLIVYDRLSAYRQVVDYFANTARRRPILFTDVSTNRSKVNAFVDQLQARGLKVDADSVLDVGTTLESPDMDVYREVLRRRMVPDGTLDFDAVVTTHDVSAAAVLQFCRRHHLRVPEDVAVVGFGDLHYAPLLDPPLASIRRYPRELADLIEQLLFARMAEPDLAPQRGRLEMQFVWRPSAGPRPAGT